jgi:hypothetical protein
VQAQEGIQSQAQDNSASNDAFLGGMGGINQAIDQIRDALP